MPRQEKVENSLGNQTTTNQGAAHERECYPISESVAVCVEAGHAIPRFADSGDILLGGDGIVVEREDQHESL